MRTVGLALLVLCALSSPAMAATDDGDGDGDALAPDGAEVELPLDDATDRDATAEDPGSPRPGGVHARVAPPPPATPMPRRLADRPLTLPRGTLSLAYQAGFGGLTEKIAYSYPGNDELVRAGGTVRVAYGITDDVEIGLRYGTGTLGTIGDAGARYEPGKTVALEARYRLRDWVALRAAVPIHVDPVAAALTLGAPIKLHLTDNLALVMLENVVTVVLDEFVPFPDDEVSNGAAAAARTSGTILADGDITLEGRVIYQVSDTTAVAATLGVVAQDFSMEKDPGMPLLGSVMRSVTPSLDLFARAGFFNLADATTTVHIGAGIVLRI